MIIHYCDRGLLHAGKTECLANGSTLLTESFQYAPTITFAENQNSNKLYAAL